MSKKKIQKRLVSKGQYIGLMSMKITLFTLGTAVLLCAICRIFYVLPLVQYMGFRPDNMEAIGSVTCLLTVLLSLAGLALGGGFIVAGQGINPEKTISHLDSVRLPEQTSLVRASDLPPTVQQAELLRAPQAGQETPQEQLLRTTMGEE